MKILKTVAALAALSTAASAFAEVNLTASNKLKSDVVVLTHEDAADETTNTFPGIKNVINAEVTSDHVDAMVEGVIVFKDFTSQNDVGLAWDGEISDWYVEARLLDDLLTLGFHDNIHPEGSYLPIWDDNIGAGNIGSEGFTLVVRPIDGLRIGLSLPFGADEYNWLKVDGAKDDELQDPEQTTNIRIGAIYDLGIAEVGLAVQDVLDSDERTIGAYLYSAGLFGQVKGVDLRAGFANSEAAVSSADIWDFAIVGNNVWNVAVEVSEILPVSLAVEASGNTDSDKFQDENPYDFYTGVKVGFDVNEQLALSAAGRIALDNSSNGRETLINAKVVADYAVTENDKIEASVDFVKCDKDWGVKFPCYWKHTF